MRKLRIGFAKSPLTLNILFYPCFFIFKYDFIKFKKGSEPHMFFETSKTPRCLFELLDR